MINSALSRSFIAMTGLLTFEQTRDKCLLKNFPKAKKRVKKVKKNRRKKMLFLFFVIVVVLFN